MWQGRCSARDTGWHVSGTCGWSIRGDLSALVFWGEGGACTRRLDAERPKATLRDAGVAYTPRMGRTHPNRRVRGSEATKLLGRNASTMSGPATCARARSGPGPSDCECCDLFVGLDGWSRTSPGRTGRASRPGMNRPAEVAPTATSCTSRRPPLGPTSSTSWSPSHLSSASLSTAPSAKASSTPARVAADFSGGLDRGLSPPAARRV